MCNGLGSGKGNEGKIARNAFPYIARSQIHIKMTAANDDADDDHVAVVHDDDVAVK